ncbi:MULTISPECIES: hypothetical protein [unclassified Carboxylicivirga]|uniref:hypothetical protein n=1 Tax=Carboxylicivirga TaxID=1628153 RepID=UPI003D33CC5A
MAINIDQKKFRSERAHDLKNLADLIEKVGITGYPLREAANQLNDFTRTRKVDKNDAVDYSYWGYQVDSLEIPFYMPPRHIRPSNLNPLSLVLSIDMIASCDSWGNLVDPLKKLEFNIEIKGDGPNDMKHQICYHIDRHIDSVSNEPHPMYHLHFGGNRMNFDNMDIGQTIFFDAPRVMFYPIEVVLGIDFVLSNFFPTYWNQLQQESVYISLVKDYYDALVKPFAHTLASKWTAYNPSSIDWHPGLVFPQLANV